MTIWRPDPKKLLRPAYLSLAEQFADAINRGDLKPGARLPTHRELAYQLRISIHTVSRAYEHLIRRGLISGEVGRGSFVLARPEETTPPYLPERLGDLIDLSILKPVCGDMHLDKMREAFTWLGQSLPASAALSFRPNTIFPRHRAAAVDWIARCGLDVAALNVTVTNGATSAMTVALMAAVPPGATLAVEAVSYHTILPLSNYLGVQVESLDIDSEGLLPEALENACRKTEVRALFLQPTVINPTASMMSAERRQAIAEVARRHDVAIIENDILGPLIEPRPRPIASYAPERTLYITSFTKITVPGLRIGYLAAPDRFGAAVANRHLVTNWMATPAMAEIATRWITDGTAMELVEWQREALSGRNALAATLLQGMTYGAHPQGLHLWLPLPDGHTEDAFVSQARLRGVAIAPGSSFRTSSAPWRPSVRISLGSSTEEDLRGGLGIVASMLRGQPETLLRGV
jgi:DNA-binding transcriptional MocR family regulator